MGANPREAPNHRERGPACFKFTIADLARATSLPEEDVRRARRRGAFDPKDLRTVIRWILAEVIPQVLAP
jgi:hypothetical protein